MTVLNNLLLGSRDSKSYLTTCAGLIQILANLVNQRAKGNLYEEWILISISTLVRNMSWPGCPPLSPVLVKALRNARMVVGRGAAKDAISCAIWTYTAVPQVAHFISQSWPFLQNIITSIQEGPNSDSESHTGILANCLPQRHVDPGLVKPMVPTLLQLLKSPQIVTVLHCLRIMWTIGGTERGAEILLECKTDLYLRTLYNHSQVQIQKCAQELLRKLDMQKSRTDSAFMWQNNSYMGWGPKSAHPGSMQGAQSQGQQPGQMMYNTPDQDDETPIDFTRNNDNENIPHHVFTNQQYPRGVPQSYVDVRGPKKANNQVKG